MTEKTEQTDDVAKLAKLIEGQKVAMLVTEDDTGALRARPMWTQQVQFDGRLWFFTSDDSGKVHEVEGGKHVNVSYVDAQHDRYLSISGRAVLVKDKQKAEQLWNPLYKAWFPEGLNDPKLALLRIDVEK